MRLNLFLYLQLPNGSYMLFLVFFSLYKVMCILLSVFLSLFYAFPTNDIHYSTGDTLPVLLLLDGMYQVFR